MKKLLITILFLSIASQAQAAVAFDAASNSGDLSNLTSSSWSHTVSGSDRYLVCGLSGWDATDSLAAVTFTYNSVSLTKLGGADTAGDNNAVLWGLVAPDTGANTVAVSNIPASYGELAGGCVSFTGVDQITATGTLVIAGPPSVDVTLSSGDMGVDILYGGNGSPAAGAGETERVAVNYAGGSKHARMGTVTGSGTVTMSWTGGITDSVISAIPIKAGAVSNPPSVTSNPATGVGPIAAAMNGLLTAIGTANTTEIGFRYGETTSYGATTTQTNYSGFSLGTFTAYFSGLSPQSTYHYQAYASSSVGITYGADIAFTTGRLPRVMFMGKFMSLAKSIFM